MSIEQRDERRAEQNDEGDDDAKEHDSWEDHPGFTDGAGI